MRIKGEPIFLLDEPHYHRVQRGETHRFRGLALAVDGDPVESLDVHGRVIPVNLPSLDLATFVKLPKAERCRFEFEMRVEPPFDFVANEQTLWTYAMPPRPPMLPDIPMPPADVVAVTQGGGNVDSYRDSILSGLTTMQAILDRQPHDILDIGCGTGRLLLGWWAQDGARHLAGVDVNRDLIRWNTENLGDIADWSVCELDPPLPFQDRSFDLIQLVSVFTHLTLTRQRAWIREVQRLLRPDGVAIITLHGELYAKLLLDERLRHQFELDGHLSVAGASEGANAFASFHMPWFARELFNDFDVTFYERGPRNLFALAALQDVYVLRREARDMRREARGASDVEARGARRE